MHYHGGHTPPDSDGVPMLSFSSADRFAEGAVIGSRTYVFPNDNEFPATLWYHDHGLDVTGPNVYRGLAGFFLLGPNGNASDEQFRAADAALPNGYGRYDIPMVFQDRRFNADGSLLYNTFDHDGFLGDRFLVNGAIQPYLPVARRRYRFRWLNGSNARQYQLFLSSGDKFVADRHRRRAAARAGGAHEHPDRAGGALRGRHRLQPLPGRLVASTS